MAFIRRMLTEDRAEAQVASQRPLELLPPLLRLYLPRTLYRYRCAQLARDDPVTHPALTPGAESLQLLAPIASIASSFTSTFSFKPNSASCSNGDTNDNSAEAWEATLQTLLRRGFCSCLGSLAASCVRLLLAPVVRLASVTDSWAPFAGDQAEAGSISELERLGVLRLEAPSTVDMLQRHTCICGCGAVAGRTNRIQQASRIQICSSQIVELTYFLPVKFERQLHRHSSGSELSGSRQRL